MGLINSVRRISMPQINVSGISKSASVTKSEKEKEKEKEKD